MAKNNWTREELIIAFNLYCKTPFSKINATYKPVKELAPLIGRSDSSLAMKLANFARLDPVLQARGVKGLKGGSKGEEEIWNEFNNNWEQLAFESERILAEYKGQSLEDSTNIIIEDIFEEGKEREALVKVRVNQYFFRSTVLASYNNKCCITGISSTELLVAGHIIPWAADTKNRINPANGLCMNALHDKAFDKGLITVTPDYIIRLSEKLLSTFKNVESEMFFLPYEAKKITLPQKFLPFREFLEYHNSTVFKL
ncbi:MAG: HNH endonuclease [Bacteroidota bacterium]